MAKTFPLPTIVPDAPIMQEPESFREPDMERLGVEIEISRLNDLALSYKALTYEEMMDFINALNGGSHELADELIKWANERLGH